MSVNLGFSNLFTEAEKIVKFRKIAPFFAIMGVCAFAQIILAIWSSSQPNETFYQASITGTITDVYCDEKDVWYQIGKNWYVIINPLTENLSIGDSIIKKSDSHEIVIFRDSIHVKSRGEIKKVGFIILEDMHPKNFKE